jgi:hypothetical protein
MVVGEMIEFCFELYQPLRTGVSPDHPSHFGRQSQGGEGCGFRLRYDTLNDFDPPVGIKVALVGIDSLVRDR